MRYHFPIVTSQLPSTRLSNRSGIRRARSAAMCEALEPRLLLTALTTYHVDNQSTGYNGTEVLLTPANVNANQFGKKFSTTVDGQVYAEPLYVPNVNITSGGSQGNHNVVYVATQHDSLYAIDSASGTILWSTSFLNTANATINPMNATAMTSVPNGDVGSGDINPEIGITATPVIDQANGFLYLVAKTKQTIAGVTTNYVQILFKVDIHSGNVVTGKVLGDTINNAGNYTYITSGAAADTPYAYGTGDGNIVDADSTNAIPNGTHVVYFNALREMGRPGITLYNGTIYMAFASHGDQAPYHGWVLAYDATTLAIKGAVNTTPNGSDGGIWQGAGSMGVDAAGNLYFITGNGSFNQNSNNFNAGFTGLPHDGDYGDSFVKVSIDTTVTTQAGVNTALNPNGWGLKITDFFSPFSNAHNGDEDLGSGSVTLLPDGVGSVAHPHLLIGGGKGGVLYLVDRDNMGGFQGNPATDRMVQEIAGAFGGHGLFNAAAFYFNNPSPASGSPSGQIIIQGSGDNIRSYTISNGVITTTPTSVTAVTFGGLGGSPGISANGITNAIVWSINRSNSALYAYNANDLTVNYWNSTQTGPNNLNNSMGSNTKFSVPTIADGQVYVGTANSLVVYGLLAPPVGPPAAPSNLQATAPAFNSVHLTWSDNATNEDSFLIERTTNSNDPNSWVQIGTASTNATTYNDFTTQATTTYYYRVRAYNSYNGGSYSTYTNPIASVTTPQPPPQGTGDGAMVQFWTNQPAGAPPFPFSGSPILTRVDPTIDWNWATGSPDSSLPSVTDHFGAVWTGQLLAQYSETYTFTANFNDGAMLKIKPVGSSTWTSLFNPATYWTNSGAKTATATYAMSAGQRYDFELDYFEDTNNALVHLSWSSPSTSNQIIPQIQMYSGAAPTTPTNLVVNPQASYEVDLTWNDNSYIETGYEVQRMDPGGSWATIATLPPNANSFNDTELFADVAYSYRVRALNFAANSDFSNIATVQTPVPPAAPTNAHATGVTRNPNAISMAWIDNSVHENGYHVMRAPPLFDGQDELQFVDIAFLPANTTAYTDNGSAVPLVPGTQYTYHIVSYNLGGSNGGSDFATETITDAPTVLKATPADASASLTWTPPSFNSNTPSDLTYNVYRSTHADGSGAQQIASNLASPNFQDNSVVNGTPYYYTVTASDQGGESAPSNLAPVTPAPADTSPPSFAQSPAANPGTVTGTTTNLTVLGADNSGEPALKYTWTVFSKPAGAPDPAFTINASNAAKNTTASFTWSGTYILRATIGDAAKNETSSDVTVNVTFGFTGISPIANYHITYLGGASYTAFVDAGTVTFANDLSTGGKTVSLTLAPGTTAVLNSSQQLSTLTIPAGSTVQLPDTGPHNFLRLTSLSLTAAAKLDLFSNDLILDYTGNSSPVASVEALVTAGYNSGNWLGNALTSTAAAGNPGKYALGVLDNTLRPTPIDTFDGVDTSSHRQVFIKFTYLDDFDIDGLVTSNDAITFAAHYSENQPASHYLGDINYNGHFDSNDAILFAATYNESLPQIGPPPGFAGSGLLPIVTKSSITTKPAPATSIVTKPAPIAAPPTPAPIIAPPAPASPAKITTNPKLTLLATITPPLPLPPSKQTLTPPPPIVLQPLITPNTNPQKSDLYT